VMRPTNRRSVDGPRNPLITQPTADSSAPEGACFAVSGLNISGSPSKPQLPATSQDSEAVSRQNLEMTKNPLTDRHEMPANSGRSSTYAPGRTYASLSFFSARMR